MASSLLYTKCGLENDDFYLHTDISTSEFLHLVFVLFTDNFGKATSTLFEPPVKNMSSLVSYSESSVSLAYTVLRTD